MIMTAPVKPEDVTETREADEYERLLSFREQMFRQLGFNDFQGVALAEAHVDWHSAEDLLKRGCPKETAVDLLL